MMPIYYVLAYFLPLSLGVWAVLAAENETARLVIASLILFLYARPFLLHLSAWVWYFGRIILGIGCFLYLRWHGIAVK